MGTVTGLDERNWLLAGKPTGTFFESVPYDWVNVDQAIAASGVMLTVGVLHVSFALINAVMLATVATFVGLQP